MHFTIWIEEGDKEGNLLGLYQRSRPKIKLADPIRDARVRPTQLLYYSRAVNLTYMNTIKPEKGKRQKFLGSFFNALGACDIRWIYQDADCVAGTVIYDPANPDEQQDFIWHIEENKTPNEEVTTVLDHLKEYELLDMDKLKVPAAAMIIPALDEQSKVKAFDALFKVRVSMVEDGQITDFYWIHE